MMTDAMLFNLSGGNAMKKETRMDRTLDLLKGSAQEFGKSSVQQDASAANEQFRTTYERIAKANEAARMDTERSASVKETSREARIRERTVQDRHDQEDRVDQTRSTGARNPENVEHDDPVRKDHKVRDDRNGTQEVTEGQEDRNNLSEAAEAAEAAETGETTPVNGIQETEQPVTEQTDTGTANAQDASELIRNALAELSDALGLSIRGDLSSLSFGNVSQETSGQFAEILYALKGITAMLDKAVQAGRPMEFGSTVLDIPKMGELEQLIRTSQFKLEIGLSMLGASEDVGGQLADKLNIVSTSGIVQALNPSDLQMSASQVKQVFGNIITDPQQQMSILAEKVRELVKEMNLDKPAVTTVVGGNAAPTQDVRKNDLAPFDTQVMRTLLKIDAKMVIAAQNTEAAVSNEKFNLPFNGAQAIAKNLSELSKGKAFLEQLNPVAVLNNHGQAPLATQLTDVKSAGHFMRALEESVFNQISDKLHSAVRSGVTEVRIQLRPESLGEVHLKIRMEGDIVMARIQVENQQVKQIVENSLQLLKDSLSQQHLQAGSLEVNVGNQGNPQADRAWDEGASQGHGDDENREHGREQAGPVITDNVQLGRDTGRRFGSNTVEYFA